MVILRALRINDFWQRKLNCFGRLETLFFHHLRCYHHRLLLKLSQLGFRGLIWQGCSSWSKYCNTRTDNIGSLLVVFILIVWHGKTLLLGQTWFELYLFAVFWSWVNNYSLRSNWGLGKLRTTQHINAIKLVLHGRNLVFPVIFRLLHQVFKSIFLGQHSADTSRRLPTTVTASRLLLVQIGLLLMIDSSCCSLLLLILALSRYFITLIFAFAAKVDLLGWNHNNLLWFL